MTLGNKIAALRKELGLTQEALAQKLEVTNQAVSKWESDSCCPDIMLLPRLADVFGVTIDALFGREPQEPAKEQTPFDLSSMDWEDDGILRVVLFAGRQLIAEHPAREELTFCYEGPALTICSQLSVTCEDVGGDVHAGGHVTCGDVAGNVTADGSVTCDAVSGDVHAEGSVTCDDVAGSVFAEGDVTCDCINGSVTAGGNITCGEINDSTIKAAGTICCDELNDCHVEAAGGIHFD